MAENSVRQRSEGAEVARDRIDEAPRGAPPPPRLSK